MGWNVYLYDDRGHCEFEANYTHNTNGMISAALVATGDSAPDECGGLLSTAIGPMWWIKLDGTSGESGAAYLDQILMGLRSDPVRFRAMNPPNGWGDYDSLVELLQEMRDAVPNWPTQWTADG